MLKLKVEVLQPFILTLSSICQNFQRLKFLKFGVIHDIQPRSISFSAMYSYKTAVRRMISLTVSWASTVHKMQVSTVDNAVVYLGSKLFNLYSQTVKLTSLSVELDP